MATQPQSPSEERERRATALVDLLHVEHRRLIEQARAHSRWREDAEDALSDACVQFLRFYDGPSGEDALHWMLLVVKRCAWAIGRGRVPERIDLAMLGESAGPVEIAERGEETEQTINAIAQLKRDERVALILFGLGYSYAEIHELRGWSTRKVHRCLAEGRRRVREMLERGDS